MYHNPAWCASSGFEPAAAHQIGSPSRCTWLLSPNPRNRHLSTPSVVCIALQPSITTMKHWIEVFLADLSNTLQHFVWKTGVKNFLWFYWHLHVSDTEWLQSVLVPTYNGVNQKLSFISFLCSRYVWAMSWTTSLYKIFDDSPNPRDTWRYMCILQLWYSRFHSKLRLHMQIAPMFTQIRRNTIQQSKLAVKWTITVRLSLGVNSYKCPT
jgi:hypothetical protein